MFSRLSTFIVFLLFISCGTESTPTYTLKVNVSPPEAGSVDPTGGEFNEGALVNITATANEPWFFSGWSNGSMDNPTSIFINHDQEITAIFRNDLNISVIGEGSVEKELLGTDQEGNPVLELTAIPEVGYDFSHWTGDIYYTIDSINLAVEGELNITVVFTAVDDVLEGIYLEDLTLTAENSPYVLTGTLQIGPEATLTIEPGVEIIGSYSAMGGGTAIEVFGELLATGTEEQRITISRTRISTMYASNGANFAYTNLIRSSLSGRDITVTDSFIYSTGGLDYRYLSIEKSVIYLASRNNSIRQPAFIKNSYIGAADEYEITVESDNIAVGIESIFEGNHLANPDLLTVKLHRGSNDVDISGNYWGTTDTEIIDSIIYDRNDDLNEKAYIIYEPILSTPSPLVPSPPDSLISSN